MMAALNTDWINLASLIWFFFCWIGYSRFAKHQAKKVNCIASVMHHHRVDWMHSVLTREIRVGDAAIISNLEKNVSFMASTSMLILAGLITVIANTDQVTHLFSTLPFSTEADSQFIQFKFLILCIIFIYAFFTFTWALRQFGFCGVLIGAAPNTIEKNISEEECQVFAQHCGKILDQASHSYNFGLRSFYYSMAMLAWFIHPLLFILATTIVVAILYQREFRSKSLQALLQVNMDWHQHEKKS